MSRPAWSCVPRPVCAYIGEDLPLAPPPSESESFRTFFCHYFSGLTEEQRAALAETLAHALVPYDEAMDRGHELGAGAGGVVKAWGDGLVTKQTSIRTAGRLLRPAEKMALNELRQWLQLPPSAATACVAFRGWSFHNARLYLVQERMDGDWDQVFGSNTEQANMAIWVQVVRRVEALAALGVHHYDLKPGNVFGKDGVWKLGDLGCATDGCPKCRTREYTYLPHQVQHARGVCGSKDYYFMYDMYSLGVLLLQINRPKKFALLASASHTVSDSTHLSLEAKGLEGLIQRMLGHTTRPPATLHDYATALWQFWSAKCTVEDFPPLAFALLRQELSSMLPGLAKRASLTRGNGARMLGTF